MENKVCSNNKCRLRQTVIGIVGCGDISDTYFENAKKTGVVRVKGCSSINMNSARQKAELYGCKALTLEELLSDAEVELVLNLTVPNAHEEVGFKVIESGKHLYSEKPLALETAQARQILHSANVKGVRVGCAPDTFMGAGLQTARKLLDEGKIGRPIGGSAFMCSRGPAHWHPNPDVFYDKGGGPMLDMGPYYITALVSLLGPVKRVTGITRKTFKERIAGAEQNTGRKIQVNTDTHITGVIEFHTGAAVNITMSFDVWAHNLPGIELYGTCGSMKLPSPNEFAGSVGIWCFDKSKWVEEAPVFPENARIIGVVDMVAAIRSGRQHRCSGELALHVLEVMTAFEKSSKSGQHVMIESTVPQPPPLPPGLEEWEIGAD